MFARANLRFNNFFRSWAQKPQAEDPAGTADTETHHRFQVVSAGGAILLADIRVLGSTHLCHIGIAQTDQLTGLDCAIPLAMFTMSCARAGLSTTPRLAPGRFIW